ncbi:hypothetical protein Q5752_003422 [Cryptotrichosporon argae]
MPPPPLRRRSSLIAPTSPQPGSPTPSGIPRPQSAASQYRHGRTASESASASVLGDRDGDDKGQVKVVVRIRPADPDDANVPPRYRTSLVKAVTPTEVRLEADPAALAGVSGSSSVGKRHPTFTFDRVLSESATQLDLYDATARDSVEEFLKGFNVTFLAYGQTSSGKSYSMGTTGDDADYEDVESNPRAGLIPRTVEAIFRRADEIRLASGPGASFEVRVSFLELYNEEIIDLLSGSPVAAAIRETSDGRIVWSGVREVRARSVADVMALLHEGAARRRTGSTSMNATSSRSHAIFSLTLTQTRRAQAQADAAPAPLPTTEFGVVSPARTLTKRPSSMIGYNASRSSTPTSRVPPPSSFASHQRTTSARPATTYASDEMIVVTSKFNMVDLAGSERLKRTAAQGDRMKEGISINSGLLALGNVISALSEPAKNRGHIPYRDSKLTRMLQDSIGGNSLTTMIACVSPIEYNISETFNTISYASRARKIRNSLQKNQVEVGWDDLDYLRTTILKLRAKLASVEPDGAGPGAAREEGEGTQTQVELLNDRLSDLQKEFAELQNEYFKKCHELVALSDPQVSEDDKLKQFNQTIEPVILEYEKVVTSLNERLAELQNEIHAALLQNDETTRALTATRDLLAQNEAYVQDLRTRVSRLSERNESSEAHIRDLEAKLRSHSDVEERHAGVVAQFTQDIQHLREESLKQNAFIAQLEGQLATSDTKTAELLATIERHEQQAVRREEAYRELESRMALFDTNQEHNNLLLEELDQRNRRIEDLESRLHAASVSRAHSTEPETPMEDDVFETPLETPPQTPTVFRTIAEDTDEALGALRRENAALVAKLREAEQQNEQLRHDQVLAGSSSESAASDKRKSMGDESSESGSTPRTPRHRSRGPSPDVAGSAEDGDDVFADGGPLSASPTGVPSYATLRQDFRVGRGEGRLLRPLSLSQGLSFSASSAPSPRGSWSAPSGLTFDRMPKRLSIPYSLRPTRSAQTLEVEVGLLQKTVADREVQLKQREVEIRYLKKTLEQQTLPIPSPSFSADEVASRIRQEHADALDTFKAEYGAELERVHAIHQDDLEQLRSTHADALIALGEQHEATAKALHEQHAAATAALREEHDGAASSLRVQHEAAATQARQALESAEAQAREAVAAAEARHLAELEAISANHHAAIAELERQHAATLATLRSELDALSDTLQSVQTELDAAAAAKAVVERELAARPDPANVVALEEHSIVIAAMEEMEKSLAAVEDEKRQLKMRADQARFELSRVRDEHQVARSGDLKQIADLDKRMSVLAKENDELRAHVGNRDSKQSITGGERSARPKLPPIGPPPSAPLPPLPPASALSPSSTTASLPRFGHESVPSISSEPSAGGSAVGPSSRETEQLEHAVAVARQATQERDQAIAERDEAVHEAGVLQERAAAAEARLADVARDAAELRKNNSKIKVRVEDAMREATDARRDRDVARRDAVDARDELEREQSEHEADLKRLETARADAVRHKVKYEQLVDSKVNKSMSQKLKCF